MDYSWVDYSGGANATPSDLAVRNYPLPIVAYAKNAEKRRQTPKTKKTKAPKKSKKSAVVATPVWDDEDDEKKEIVLDLTLPDVPESWQSSLDDAKVGGFAMIESQYDNHRRQLGVSLVKVATTRERENLIFFLDYAFGRRWC